MTAPSPAIDAKRYLADQHALRQFGKHGTGVVRPAFSEPDIEARRWLAGRFSEAGLTPVFDPVGNLFGLPPGDGTCLLLGSHSDSQKEGGWLDGAYGVIASLEVVRALNEAGSGPVALVSFQDEESHFGPLTGSRVAAGLLDLEQALELKNADGRSLGEARKAMPEVLEASPVSLDRFHGFIEAHIEQGPVLDTAGEAIGVVEAIVAFRQCLVTLKGEQNHAGTTPMALRKDAVAGFIAAAQAVGDAVGPLLGPVTVWTIGRVEVKPNAPSIVPGEVRFTVQMRDPDADRLDRMMAAAQAAIGAVAEARGLGHGFAPVDGLKPTPMDAGLIGALSEAAEQVSPGRWRRMPSGAVHDASNMAAHMPVGMLFVPSIRGISHSFEEDTAEPDLVTGVEVLCAATARLLESGWRG